MGGRMKYAPLLIALTLFPYGALVPQQAGNPDASAYLGGKDGIYDAKANPAQTIGTVTYDAMGPMTKTPDDVVMATPSGSATSPVAEPSPQDMPQTKHSLSTP
jgi:hypothetical protein